MGADPFLPLEGVTNFRDAGGVATLDGGEVRRGLLYRSSRLSRVTDGDAEMLAVLGVRHIYDLREPEERKRSPTRWPGPAIRVWSDRDHLPSWQVKIMNYPQDPAGMRGFLTDLYAELPHAFAPRIADIVRDIGAGETPCVVHCSAGKDRTGVVIGVLLALAGVDRADIMAEYLLTEGRFGVAEDQQRAFAEKTAGGMRSAEAQQALWSADVRFLNAAFASIESRYGSVQGYATQALGLDAQQIAAFRAILCTAS